MKKAILWILIFLVMASVQAANNTISTLQVFPQDVLNPATNWQYIRIAAPKTASYDHMFKFYDDIGKSEIQQLINGRWVPVDFSLDKAYKAAPQADSSSFSSKHSIQQEKDSVLYYRVQYSPYKDSGKWDLVIEDQLGAKTTLDPYWHTADQNTTYGYVYLTTNSFTDTFTSYGIGTANISDYWNNQSGAYWVNSTINGYGFTDYALEDIQPAAAWHYFNMTVPFTADNFEILFQLAIEQDLGTDYCEARIGTTSTTATFRTLDSVNANLDMGGNHFDADFLPPPDTIYQYQFIKNGTTCTFKYKDLGSADWQDTITDSCSGTLASLRFGTNAAECLFNDVVIRKTLTIGTSGQDYHASFIYGSSNATAWDNVSIDVYRYDTLEDTITDTSPTDQEIPTYTYTVTEPGVYYYNVTVCDTLGYCAYNQTQSLAFDLAYLNITIMDETSDSILYVPADVTLLSTYNNTDISINGSEIVSLLPGDYEFRYSATGYDPRTYYATIAPNTNSTIYLYLLNSTVSDFILHTVYDENSDTVANVTIKLQRNYVSGETSVFKTVSMTRTNFEGNAGLYVVLYDVWYKIIYEDSTGTVLEVTDPSPFFELTSDNTIRLGGDTYESFRIYDNMAYNLSFVNDTGTIYARFIYSDSQNIVRYACLNVQRLTTTDLYDVCYNCTTASGATISCLIDHTLPGTYKAVALVDTNTTGSWYPLDALFYTPDIVSSLGTGGAFLGVMLITTVGMMGIATITGSLMLLILALLGVGVIGLISGFNMSLAFWIIIPAIIIMFLVRKK